MRFFLKYLAPVIVVIIVAPFIIPADLFEERIRAEMQNPDIEISGSLAKGRIDTSLKVKDVMLATPLSITWEPAFHWKVIIGEVLFNWQAILNEDLTLDGKLSAKIYDLDLVTLKSITGEFNLTNLTNTFFTLRLLDLSGWVKIIDANFDIKTSGTLKHFYAKVSAKPIVYGNDIIGKQDFVFKGDSDVLEAQIFGSGTGPTNGPINASGYALLKNTGEGRVNVVVKVNSDDKIAHFFLQEIAYQDEKGHYHLDYIEEIPNSQQIFTTIFGPTN